MKQRVSRYCRRCEKTAYLSERGAREVLNRRMDAGAPGLRVYECPYVNYWWHLTKVPFRRR